MEEDVAATGGGDDAREVGVAADSEVGMAADCLPFRANGSDDDAASEGLSDGSIPADRALPSIHVDDSEEEEEEEEEPGGAPAPADVASLETSQLFSPAKMLSKPARRQLSRETTSVAPPENAVAPTLDEFGQPVEMRRGGSAESSVVEFGSMDAAGLEEEESSSDEESDEAAQRVSRRHGPAAGHLRGPPPARPRLRAYGLASR